MHIISLAKGKSRWIIEYDDGSIVEVLEHINEMADRDEGFTWIDAAMLWHQVVRRLNSTAENR